MTIRDGLDYIVQCKWPDKWFETIAAFNDESVALAYANECRKANSRLEYRVENHVSLNQKKESTS